MNWSKMSCSLYTHMMEIAAGKDTNVEVAAMVFRLVYWGLLNTQLYSLFCPSFTPYSRVIS